MPKDKCKATNAAMPEAFYGRPVGELAPVQVAMFYALRASFVCPRDRSATVTEAK